MIDSPKLKVLAVTAILFTFLAAGASVDPYTYILSKQIRLVFFLGAIVAAFFIILQQRAVSKNATYIVLIILSLAIFQFPQNHVSLELVQITSHSIIVIVLAYMMSAVQFSEKIKIYNLLIGLVAAYVVVLILTSSLTFDGFVPVILFSNIPEREGMSLATYSQGVSRIFSVALIAVAYKLIYERSSLWPNVALISLALAYLIFALAGGSRGEVLNCIVLLVIMVSRSWKHILLGLGILILVALVLTYTIDDFDVFEKFPTVWRLLNAYETSDLGARDTLALQALSLLWDNPRCIVLGCGLTYFQSYYGHEFGGYPHNWILEFLISFGYVPLVIIIGAVVIFVVRHYKGFSDNEKFLMFLTLYFFGNSLKSGTIVDAPLLYGAFFAVLFTIRKPRRAAQAVRQAPPPLPPAAVGAEPVPGSRV